MHRLTSVLKKVNRLVELGGFVYSAVSKTVVADEVREFMARLTQGNGGIPGYAPVSRKTLTTHGHRTVQSR